MAQSRCLINNGYLSGWSFETKILNYVVWIRKVKVKSLSRVRLFASVDCSPPGSSVHGILQARILEWVAISFSRGSSRPRDWTQVSCIAGRCLTPEPPGKLPVWIKNLTTTKKNLSWHLFCRCACKEEAQASFCVLDLKSIFSGRKTEVAIITQWLGNKLSRRTVRVSTMTGPCFKVKVHSYRM